MNAEHRSVRVLRALAWALAVLGFAAPGLRADDGDLDLLRRARELFGTLPKDASRPDRPITPKRVRLGRMLFFEPRMSDDGTVSCSRCHLPGLAATDALPRSIGAHDLHAPRNAPTVFYAALHPAQHWDGRFADVEDQAEHAPAGPAFGNADPATVAGRLKAIGGYDPLFREAFPGEAEPIAPKNWGAAIGAFERTLVTPSRFDAFLAGKADALSDAERKGLRVFIETGCVGCHKGPGVGGSGFRKFGVFGDYREATGRPDDDKGRFALTKKPEDVDKFKVSGLRQVAATPPYFHDGSVADLPRAVRVMARVQLDAQLSDEEVGSIVAFLGSLSGPEPGGYSPPPLPTGGFTIPAPSPSR